MYLIVTVYPKTKFNYDYREDVTMSEQVIIRADFLKPTGNRIKPMHGVGQPPFYGLKCTYFHYLEEAGIPYSRLHDVGGWFGGNMYVDVPNIFRNFDADVNDPASYDFDFTDILIKGLYEYGVQPIYRLGITIENFAKIHAYRVYPPKDFQKWAEICEHIVRHYNEGWANGFHFGIQFWEIWNEPDCDYRENRPSATWQGTREQFFSLYETASKHLRACFGDSIKIGGPASTGFNPFMTYDPDLEGVDPQYAHRDNQPAYRIDWAHKFLKYVKDTGSPLDFFTWHGYSYDEKGPEVLLNSADYCRRLLNKYGFENVPDHLNEWSVACDNNHQRSTLKTASQTFAVLLGMQKKSPSVLCYYDARIGPSLYGGMFNPDTHYPYPTYYGFKAFNTAYKLGNEVENDCDTNGIYLCAARNDTKGVLLIANTNPQPVELEFDVAGADMSKGEVIITDDEYRYTLVGEIIKNNKLKVKAYSCIEIRLPL